MRLRSERSLAGSGTPWSVWITSATFSLVVLAGYRVLEHREFASVVGGLGLIHLITVIARSSRLSWHLFLSQTFDFADREATLAVTSPAGTAPVVTASAYLPAGPLAELTLGNGTAETRSFTPRYFPQAIALNAARDRGYTFMTDSVGNVRSITEAVECLNDVVLENRTVTGTEVHQSCGTITAGPAVTVSAGGALTLRGATSVVLASGFSVASGASFSAGTDPDLDGSTWTFDYQDVDYFLTSAIGPWGDLAWTYDRIGNRLSESRDGWTDAYEYVPNTTCDPVTGTCNNTPRLLEIQLAVGGERSFAHGPAGHLTTVSSSGNVVNFGSDAAGRLEVAERLGATTPFTYDGRSFLAEAGTEAAAVGATRPVYSSDGLLHTLTQQVTTSDPGKTHHVVHPVAQLSVEGVAETWRYLTTDHLGTPWVATDAAGVELWHGPFEPFGRDRWAGTNLAASTEDVFLRFPGQWDDEAWLEATRGAEVYYNLHRWYQSGTGRYTRPDPMGAEGDSHPYLYATANPLLFFDPLGEKSRVCRTPVPFAPGPAKHCFIEYEDHRNGESTTYGLHRVKGKGCKYKDDSFDRFNVPDRNTRTQCGPWLEVCGDNICLDRAFDAYPNPSDYQLIRGPNSNSFARTLANACGLTPPSIVGETGQTPGWNKEGRPAKERNFRCPPQR